MTIKMIEVMRSSIRRVPRKKGQLSLPKLDKNGQRRGGWRPNAGRPRKGVRSSSPHKRRREIDATKPQHVVLRVDPSVRWLRTPKMHRAIRMALVAVLDRAHEFRIVHYSIQGNHLHLLCEASDRMALARGAQAFEISAAAHLNREMGRSGQVFPDRYHAESIDSVRQTNHTLSYVLNNWRKHKQDGGVVGLFDGKIDPFSSGVVFPGWAERTQPVTIPDDYEAPPVSMAQSWYLTHGYKLGPPISVWAVPSEG
jgi:REP element-mobilizing transposase RayT